MTEDEARRSIEERIKGVRALLEDLSRQAAQIASPEQRFLVERRLQLLLDRQLEVLDVDATMTRVKKRSKRRQESAT